MKKYSTPLLILLVVILVFLTWRYRSLYRQAESQLAAAALSAQTLEFTQLFIEKILQAEGAIDFDTRLELENRVRALQNPEILAAWQSFTSSATQAEAQQEVKELLALLIDHVEADR